MCCLLHLSQAQVQSSDAKKNAPFILQLSGSMASLANIKCNDFCTLKNEVDVFPRWGGGELVSVCVDIPKSKVLECEILNYSMNVKTQNMPIVSVSWVHFLVMVLEALTNFLCAVFIS